MTTITDTDSELRELARLHDRHQLIAKTIEERIFALWRGGGISLEELGAAIGKSASQMSRILKRLERNLTAPAARPAITAMALVRQAQRGDIDHEEFVALLKNWQYEPKHKSRGESDDWEIVDNSFDAIYHAYVGLDLLSDEEYEEVERVANTSNAADSSIVGTGRIRFDEHQ